MCHLVWQKGLGDEVKILKWEVILGYRVDQFKRTCPYKREKERDAVTGAEVQSERLAGAILLV